MNKMYLNDPTVQLLKSVGFSDEYIENGIASGDIILKSVEEEKKAGEHESETKEEKDIDKLEKEAVEKEEKVKDDEKKTEDMMKSFQEGFLKSFGSAFTPVLEGLAKSIQDLKDEVSALKGQTPNFRSSGLENLNAIQKSVSFEKDENNKTEINIVSQRAAAVALIEKAITTMDEEDEDLKKSLENEALAYTVSPDANTVGENLARYMYKKGIKFVK